MFAILALLAFVLLLFRVDVENVSFLALGLCFVAAHLIFDFRPWVGRGR